MNTVQLNKNIRKKCFFLLFSLFQITLSKLLKRDCHIFNHKPKDSNTGIDNDNPGEEEIFTILTNDWEKTLHQ